MSSNKKYLKLTDRIINMDHIIKITGLMSDSINLTDTRGIVQTIFNDDDIKLLTHWIDSNTIKYTDLIDNTKNAVNS